MLREPCEFYSELLSRAGRARERVVVASLYWGTGEQEQQLARAVQASLQAQPGLRAKAGLCQFQLVDSAVAVVQVLLDWCRGR